MGELNNILKVDKFNKIVTSEKESFNYRAVALLIFNSKNQILIKLRSKDSIYYPNRFDFSIATRCRENETIDESALRAINKFNFKTETPKFISLLTPSNERKNIFHYIYRTKVLDSNNINNKNLIWMDLEKVKDRINENPNLFCPALKSSLLSFFGISNILIIDDNPIPTIKTVEVLIKKFSNENYEVVFDDLQNKDEWEKLLKNKEKEHYNNFYGLHFTFLLPENKTLTIYFYNPRLSIHSNNSLIIERIFSKRFITHIWMDYGRSPIKLVGENREIVIEEDGYSSKSIDQLEDSRFVKYLAKANQLAFYSYYPQLNQYKINKLKKEVWRFVKDKPNLNLSEDSIYFIETSETFKIYDFESRLADIKETIPHRGQALTFLGTINAYEKYGVLLANILYDLQHLNLYKKEKDRYNFFNEINYDFLKKIKLINNNYKIHNKNIFQSNNFKLGLISFQYLDSNNQYFLIDTPYKEYYKDYDKEINTNKNLNSIFNGELLEDNMLLWIKYVYHINTENDFDVYYECSNSELKKASLEFLRYLHSAIFYDPVYFYNKKDTVNINIKNDIADLSSKDRVEVVYYLNKVDILNNFGIMHFCIFRKISNKSSLFYNEGCIKNTEIEEIYDNFGLPILTPLVEETVFPFIENEMRKYSLLNALSTVLNRNGSHNLGSHVLAVLSNEDLIHKFLNNEIGEKTIYTPQYFWPLNTKINDSICKDKHQQNKESLIAYFNAYLKNRLDLLAAVGTSGETVILNNKPLFSGVFKNFERNLILLEHLSGKGSDFTYKFYLTIDDERIDSKSSNDIEVAIPNDLLGDQAFYLLLENVIRNTAKHGIYDCNKEDVTFTINVNKEKSNINFYAVEIWDNTCLQERVVEENKNLKELENQKSKKTIIAETNERIDKEILKDDFNIREGGWGTIEMKIACCYLSGLSLKYIDDDKYKTNAVNNKLPIIHAFEKQITSTKSYLGYRFYVQKPKSVLVVDLDNTLKVNPNDSLHKLKDNGIDIYSHNAFERAIERKEIFKHQFIVAVAKKEIKDLDNHFNNWHLNKKLPNRCLFVSDINLINKDLLNLCYRVELDKVNPFNEDSKEDKYLINVKDDFTYCLPDGWSNSKFLRLKNRGDIEFNFEGKFDHHKKTGIKDKLIYNEPYGSISSLGIFLQNLDDKGKKVTTYFKLLEAIKTKILVIDERVQNTLKKEFRLDQNGGHSVLFDDIYKATNIIIPQKKYENFELNLNKPQDYIENIKRYIKQQITDNKIDFFIFHFGILEKIIPNGTKENYKLFLDECRVLSKHPIKIVLTSGRGIPSDLPDNEYFCNFSSINYYLTDTVGRSKLHLTELLHNQRTK